MRLRLSGLLVAAGLWLTACAPAASPAAPPTTAASSGAGASGAQSTAAAAGQATTAPAGQPTTTAAGKPTTAAAAQPTTAAAASGPPVALHVSYSNLIADNLPEWMAYESGIFKQNGLDVKLDNIASSTGIPAVISGDVQIAHLGGSETLSASAAGADLVIVAITGPVYPFVFMAPASITSTDQLKGKKIGVSNVGSSSDIATRVMLGKIGLDPQKDVTIVPVGSLQNRMAALLSGAIDGGVAQPPDQIALEDKGFHVLYDLAAQKLPSVGDCIVVNRQWMNAHQDVMQKYVDSIVQAIALSKKNKEQSLPVLGKYLQNDDQRALGVTYDFFVGTVTPDYPSVNPALFGDAVEQLSAQNDKIKSFDLNSILDNEFVQSAMQRKVGP
jgi:NitT/TauT family transport system substrate-binding protein